MSPVQAVLRSLLVHALGLCGALGYSVWYRRTVALPPSVSVQLGAKAPKKRKAREMVQASAPQPPPVSPTEEAMAVAAPVASSEPVVSDSESEQQTEGDSEGGLGGGEQKASAQEQYAARLRQALEENRYYPEISRRLRQEGRVVVAFSVRASGVIEGLRLMKACPFAELNEAALETVHRLGRFEPIPAVLGVTALEYQVPIDFSLD